ncbi:MULTISPECIES: phytoene/squalene synthase family protein [Rhizobium]|uniref:phytoene/squalene synthase family protein n=1 Tax=Rhizobium TaxID=379 RepID=UPI001B3250F0|nr:MULTISPECIES: phytoene/squalene synthase family protein [Rhizobium]MBX4907074.1 phytoene/squalene synthase family protein [Rhizobium bangladeshense]MBX5217797.1 phytoene/squalene synthase family protein [Rhizobium sp. NLR9a]MBX5229928.1 phytoene/squalene synthase family protein [Rhizobium sp. NLR9b]MBX5236235.1 phytoene/squalene synthase family protein [Rhizobium sp. NLR4a]MBX5241847.1 phytoene/squalene synthase family protein [Rhizobium sp. NLR22b]
MADAKIATNQDVCLAMLRDNDRDRYLACLLSPEEKRGALAALYAFNAELARIRDLVHEPLPGEVRMQYWRDLLEGSAHGSTAANPVAAALLTAIETHRLPRRTLLNMIDARTFDLYDDPMETRVSLEGYAGETASALIQLASLVLSPEAAPRSADAAGYAGVAQAIAGLLLLMPLHRRRGQIYIPLQILAATGLDRDAFLAGEDRPRISAAIEAFAGLGLEHLAKARGAGAIAPAVFPAFLPATLAEPVLLKAQRRGVLLFDRPLQSPQWRRQLRMALAAGRRKI